MNKEKKVGLEVGTSLEKKAFKYFKPPLPPELTMSEATELFGNIRPMGNRAVICAALPYNKLPGSNIIIKKDDAEEYGLTLARKGALVINCERFPELKGKNIISNDSVGDHQMKVTINKDITLEDGTVVKDHPTDYLCIVIFDHDIVCVID